MAGPFRSLVAQTAASLFFTAIFKSTFPLDLAGKTANRFLASYSIS
jgi:hypothetical protein